MSVILQLCSHGEVFFFLLPNFEFSKPHKSLDEQIELLRSRGLIINDPTWAKSHLAIIGYYRLSSYWFHMEERGEDLRLHRFKQNTTFESILEVYVFDQKLRSMMLEAIERIEIAIRAKWAYYLSEESGAHAHCVKELFKDPDEYNKSFKALIEDINRIKHTSSEICHYLKTYSEPKLPPIWMIVSCMSFGELLRWVKNTESTKVKRSIAKDIIGTQNINLFEGIMRQLSTVRNICAHHGRFWDQRFITRMPVVRDNLLVPMSTQKNSVGQVISDNKVYNTLLIVAHLMLRLSQDTSWPTRLATLVNSSITDEQQRIMGFPAQWKALPIWNAQSL